MKNNKRAFIVAPVMQYIVSPVGLNIDRFDLLDDMLKCQSIGYKPIILDELLDHPELLLSGGVTFNDIKVALHTGMHISDAVYISSSYDQCIIMDVLKSLEAWPSKKKLYYCSHEIPSPGMTTTIFKKISDALKGMEQGFNNRCGWFFTNGMKANQNTDNTLSKR